MLCNRRFNGSEFRVLSREATGRVETRHARDIYPLLELLANLSSTDPTTIGAWLTNCAPEWSPWGALKGLELELNNRDEKVGEPRPAERNDEKNLIRGPLL